MIHYLFGISALTPIKIAWVALTLLNVALMFWVFVKSPGFAFPCYMISAATTTMLQGQKDWRIGGELGLAFWSSLWVYALLPKDKPGRIFSLSIGLIVTCVLIYVCPPSWPNYDPAMYHTRLFSTAAFLGISFGAALITRNPSTMLAVPWFMAVMIAGSQRGWDRWVVGLYTNLIWTFCLICWLSMSRASQATSSTPDAPGAHRQSSRYPA